MQTKIICGFPGIGKSYLYRSNKLNATDSDSSNFKWINVKDGSMAVNPEFPQCYIDHIKWLSGRVEYIRQYS